MRYRLYHRQSGHDKRRVHQDELCELQNVSNFEHLGYVCLSSCTFRMNGKCGSINWLIPNYHITIFVHQDKVRYTNLREVLREGIKPKVISENGVTN